ncbi:MAG: hypothetical protein A2729_04590 [Candidatus Buchananbacteria bacterium RIFCSPHIGHO2_01_FULL_39_14]|uniref:PilN domain-containing protein n=2 Tax=Candidatus Buchananiibacteriota TaxID=1817903 RepID=A0A1G1YSC3_9BACT|nr:MAG: hypothetical protein A2729_04590 [Candidatus Buchananbacteria bacterium RIFCSPHIGHO2_01_FULL_39_14]OGY49259.1 MAG: hypothetical protein A3D39_03115 [Candidatus Buchananbacteria bacterium RIFCSPHIGHO2_02_FULL_39_17]OGY54327.1 MAG: hypothetical protein A2912_04815 [Candidatus Buchananbacteria bacterium RIFCSPLOWO2_01_FULL_40_23b]
MITLNLLPPVKKQEFHLTQLYLMIKDLIILILLITIIIAIALLMTKLILQNHFNQIVAQTTMTTRYANIFNKDIKEFNQDLGAVISIQKNYHDWVEFFIQLNQLIPADVGLYNLSIKDNKILITGLAKTRQNLIQLKENFEESNLFAEVAIPLENLLKKDNVDFTFKATINIKP